MNEPARKLAKSDIGRTQVSEDGGSGSRSTPPRRQCNSRFPRPARKSEFPRLAKCSERNYVDAKAERKELIERGLPVARRVAYQIARRLPSSVDVNDLIGAGHEGLLKAVSQFDPTRHTTFEFYAEVRIRGAILDELRALDRVTRRTRQQLRRFGAAQEELTHELGRAPEDAEIAQRLKMCVAEYRLCLRSVSRASALAYRQGTDPDAVPSASHEESANEAATKVLCSEITTAIETLPERAQMVLTMYYAGEHTQTEIAECLGVTESRVCQLLNEAIGQLRRRLGITPPAAKGPRKARSRSRRVAETA